jgi:hypothetical protein
LSFLGLLVVFFSARDGKAETVTRALFFCLKSADVMIKPKNIIIKFFYVDTNDICQKKHRFLS